MILSCCSWALECPEADKLERLQKIGLQALDIRASMLRTPALQARGHELGLTVTCIAASHEMPKGATLDSDDIDRVDRAYGHLEQGMAHAASLGARWSYVVPDPPRDSDSRQRYFDPLCRLADHGATLGLKLCIEHFPGTAMPSVADTLEFITEAGHPNLHLLFDIGHAQMSGEDPVSMLSAAGARLGYVHLDDNDGVGDLHLALTDGVQTRDSLSAFFYALRDVGYDGPVSLEMHPQLPDPSDAIRRSLDLTQELWNP
ncbi:MAG: sugar phosphate isomerase/epimerase [Candidatus Latescibacterota bacterium]|nr:sugar phosphate isomerase/epimerase [Candidatus Latescibacterota bacterium]